MKNRLIILISTIVLILSFGSICYATNITNSINNAMHDAGNSIKNTAEDITNGVNDMTSNMGATDGANDAKTEVLNSGNKIADETRNGYNAIRTATNPGENDGYMRNPWVWLIVGVTVVGIAALIWYYNSDKNKKTNY